MAKEEVKLDIKEIPKPPEPKKIEIDINELRKRKLFVATPMFGGQCTGGYCNSMLGLASEFTKHGVTIETGFQYNESLVQRARNYLTDSFLRSGCTHLMFIDADIIFNPRDVMAMLAISDPNSEYKVLCALYPKKELHWGRVKKAVEEKVELQKDDDLAYFASGFAFNLLPGTTEIKMTEPTKVMEGATGFMLIQRSVLEEFAEAYPETKYRPDHQSSEYFNSKREINAFFDCEIDEESKRYLSEDYYFSKKVRQMGLDVWICPWIQLAHIGTYTFVGHLGALSRIGSAPN